MPKLVVFLPASGEVTHELEENTITVGRLTDNSIVIDDTSVSSHHAELTRSGGDYDLKDLGSTNGTRVNGETATEKKLQNGDVIQFGQIEARYTSDVPADRQPLPASQMQAATTAEKSHRPADFGSVSPFQKRGAKKDPAGTAVMALAGVAILAMLGAVAMLFTIQPPQ